MMHISVCPHVDEVQMDRLHNKTVIVIDVFRAMSCIVTAFAHGTTHVVPHVTVNEAKQSAKQDGLLLGGERYGKRLEGSDLGNSPRDYTSPLVNGRGIALTTTNGTRALIKASKGAHILVGCFLNALACTERACSLQRDVVFLCSGTRGTFSLEDGTAAGLMIDLILKKVPHAVCDDLGQSMQACYLGCRDRLEEFLSLSQSGQRLLRMGAQEDLRDCLEVDRYSIVPVWEQGRIISI
ncbi:2-phosphosulfolactate phosphatase [Polycladomyces subterraneus]|jgi:2-phosphosulfolactate phosphatase|uniref:Probable 2-phosphosulfolactate phosphatase n=1 Tax=Polycladomyces subterraneus TaxID=1016997 RepID=A0ABT8IL49_9BACL|nr:2-phosphosulfolactate phosphatase [Polycladomyces subterraneus]MDN4593296.1 2-phosphosulfolactate phosphatase [Polycladomyces subterraneus]